VSESVSSLVSSESCHVLSEMLIPYVLPDEPCNTEEKLCNKYYTNDNNNVVMRFIEFAHVAIHHHSQRLNSRKPLGTGCCEWLWANAPDLSTYRATVKEEQLLASLDDMNIIDITEDKGLKSVAM